MSNLIFRRISPTTVAVSYSNEVGLGELQPSDDGFYVFWPDIQGGYWDSSVLSEIAVKLDELNAPWEKMIDEYHAGESDE